MVEETQLYGLPLDEFTQARDELASHLKSEGEGDQASRVKKLKKPSVAAWALNQLARRHPDLIEELLRLRDELAEASSPSELRALSGTRKRHIVQLLRRSEEVLVEGGHAPAAGTLDKIRQSLYAGEEGAEREAMLAGTLSRELQPGGGLGVGHVFALTPEGEEDKPEEDKPEEEPTDEDRQAAADLDREARSLEDEAERLTEVAEQLQKESVAAVDVAGVAQRRALDARRRADDAQAALS